MNKLNSEKGQNDRRFFTFTQKQNKKLKSRLLCSRSSSFWLSEKHKKLKRSFNSQRWSKVAAKHNFCCNDLEENKVSQSKNSRSGVRPPTHRPRSLSAHSSNVKRFAPKPFSHAYFLLTSWITGFSPFWGHLHPTAAIKLSSQTLCAANDSLGRAAVCSNNTKNIILWICVAPVENKVSIFQSEGFKHHLSVGFTQK